MQAIGLVVLGMLAFWIGSLHERRATTGERKRLEKAWQDFTIKTIESSRALQEQHEHLAVVHRNLNDWQARLQKQPDIMKVCYQPSMN